jgi:hypothetical protein
MNGKTWQQWIKECESIAKKKGIKNVEIANATKIKPPHITRFFKAEYNARVKTFFAIWNFVNDYEMDISDGKTKKLWRLCDCTEKCKNLDCSVIRCKIK